MENPCKSCDTQELLEILSYFDGYDWTQKQMNYSDEKTAFIRDQSCKKCGKRWGYLNNERRTI